MADSAYVDVISPDEIRLKGTRVGIEQVVSAYLAGQIPEEIAVEFPTVTLEQVHGAIAYYLGDREKTDAYLRRWRSRCRQARTDQDKARQPELIQRLRRLAEERVAG